MKIGFSIQISFLYAENNKLDNKVRMETDICAHEHFHLDFHIVPKPIPRHIHIYLTLTSHLESELT